MISFISREDILGEHPKRGTKMEQRDLKSIFEECSKMNPNNPKHKDGAIFPYIADKLGKSSTTHTDDTIFIDLDHLKREHAEKIFNNFENLTTVFPALIGIQYSSSYYLKKNEAGLHIYVKTESLEAEDYSKLSRLILAVISQVIFKVCDIDLLEEEKESGKAILDTRPCNITHRFFLHYSPYQYNAYAIEFKESQISKSDLKNLIKKYNILKSKYTASGDDRIYTTTELTGSYTTTYKNITPKYFEYQDLITIANTLRNAGKDDDEIVNILCDIYNDKEGWTRRHGNSFMTYAKNLANTSKTQKLSQELFNKGVILLSSCGIDILRNQEDNDLIINTYLSEEYKDFIIDKYEQFRRILISAPTGCGKTELAIQLAKKYNAIVLVPFNSMLNLYSKDKDFVEISSSSSEQYTETKPVVMLWDQAVKYDFKDRLVISDETHLWFSERDFRLSAVKTFSLAKSWKNLICISATPSAEIDLLNLTVFKFTHKREMIKAKFVITKQADVLMNKYIKKETDNIVVFSDTYAKRLWENNPTSCLLHSSKKNSDEFQKVISTELLSNPITICTCIAYNGLNFKNTGKYTVIVNIKEGENTSNEVIQAIGRLRKAEIKEVIIAFTPKEEKENEISLEQKQLDAVIIKDFVESNEGKDLPIYFDDRLVDPMWFKALQEIRDYNSIHATKQVIMNDLLATGYIALTEFVLKYDKNEKHLELAIKKESSRGFKRMVKENDFTDMDEYQRTWKKMMDNISENVKFSWIDFINAYKAEKLMDTLLEDIMLIINVTKLSDEDFKNAYNYTKLDELQSKGLSQNKYAAIKKKFDSAWNIRNRWLLEKDTLQDNILNEFFKDFIEGETENRELGILKKKEGAAKGGQKGGQKGKRIIIKGVEYETAKAAAEALGKTPQTINNWLKTGKAKYVEC